MTGRPLAKAEPGSAPSVRDRRLRRRCDEGHHVMAGETCSRCEAPGGRLLSRSGSAPPPTAGIPQAVLAVLRQRGVPLDPATRAFMAQRLGADFSAVPARNPAPRGVAREDDPAELAADRMAERVMGRAVAPGAAADLSRVRIHDGDAAAAAARAVGARAFAFGDAVIFGAGEYRPQTSDGRRLIAHELAHVGQGDGRAMLFRTPLPGQPGGVAEPADPPKDPDEEARRPGAAPVAGPAPGAAASSASPAPPPRGAGLPAAEAPTLAPDVAPRQPAAGGEKQARTPDDLPTSDLALIDTELAEHERWGGALETVGAAGSEQRAAYVARSAGAGATAGLATGFKEGAVQSAKMHAGMKIAEKVVEKLGSRIVVKLGAQAAKFTPLPGIGAMVGGYMAAVDLVKNREATLQALKGFGTGSDIYEQLANSIDAISAGIQTLTQVANIIAGVLGAITVIMWAVAVATAGAVSPVAATLTAIALEIGAATIVIDALNALILKDLATTFRALHAFASDADPRDVEAEGEQIEKGAEGIGGFAGGALGGKAVEAGGKGLSFAGGKVRQRLAGHPAPPAASGAGPHVTAEPPAAGSDAAPPAAAAPHTTEAKTTAAPVAMEPKPAAAAPAAEAHPAASSTPSAAEPLPAAVAKPPGEIEVTAVPDPGASGVAPAAPAAETPAPAAASGGGDASPPTTAPPAAAAASPAPGPADASATSAVAAPAATPPAAAAMGALPPAAAAAPAATATPGAAAVPEQLSLPGVDGQVRTGLKPLAAPLELRAFGSGDAVPQGLEPGAIGAYAVGVDNPHEVALASQPPGAPGATRGGGRLPQTGREAAGVYAEHVTAAAIAHEVLPGHELHGPAGQRRQGRDTKEALAVSTPVAAKGIKDRADAALLAEVRRRKAAGEQVPPVEVMVRETEIYQDAIARSGAAVPPEQVSRAFLGEVDQFHDPRFGYQEYRPGGPVPPPLAGVSQAEIDAHLDSMFDAHIAAAPKPPAREATPVPSPSSHQQLSLPLGEPAARPAQTAPPVAASAPGPATEPASEAAPPSASRPRMRIVDGQLVDMDAPPAAGPPRLRVVTPESGPEGGSAGEPAAPKRRLRMIDGKIVDVDEAYADDLRVHEEAEAALHGGGTRPRTLSHAAPAGPPPSGPSSEPAPRAFATPPAVAADTAPAVNPDTPAGPDPRSAALEPKPVPPDVPASTTPTLATPVAPAPPVQPRPPAAAATPAPASPRGALAPAPAPSPQASASAPPPTAAAPAPAPVPATETPPGAAPAGGPASASPSGAPSAILVGASARAGAAEAVEPKDPQVPGGNTVAAAGPITERVNPAYAAPPATPDDLVSLRNQIINTLGARADAETFAQMMGKQEAHHAGNETPLEDIQKGNEEALTAAKAHEDAIQHRNEANTRKQAHEGKAKGKLEQYSDKAGELVTLTGPLKAVAGFTGLASHLPDEPDIVVRFKRGLLKVNSDASGFLKQLDGADKAVADQKTQQATRADGIKTDLATLDRTKAKAGHSSDTFDAAREIAQDFDEKNKQRKEDARESKLEAQKTAATLSADAAKKQGQAVSLAAAMQFWANGHKQARLAALEATSKRLQGQGYRVTAVVER